MNKDSLIQFIQHIYPVSDAKAAQIAERYNEKYILKNHFILKEGFVCNASYFIEDGLMRAYTYDLDGNDVTTAFYSKKTNASDIFFLFQKGAFPRKYTGINRL